MENRDLTPCNLLLTKRFNILHCIGCLLVLTLASQHLNCSENTSRQIACGPWTDAIARARSGADPGGKSSCQRTEKLRRRAHRSTQARALRLLGEDLRYVSRGGLKLEKALEHWKIDLHGKVCLDIGASTGGFSDCMLQHGAARVIAVDTGYGQMDFGLRNDPRIRLLEKTNARYHRSLLTLVRVLTSLPWMSLSFLPHWCCRR